MDRLSLLCSPALLEFWRDQGRAWGPVWAGAFYGAGCWFWVDAVACSPDKIPFTQYLPGIIATFALIMINAVRRDELQSFDYDEGVYCRARFWLLSAYIVSIGAIIGSVLVMLHYYALPDESKWPGLANVFSVACILGSALLFFMSRTPGEEGGGGGYVGF
ncbi:hypothetical protein N2152v2_010806 [Parachlorella kessleri]